MLVYQVFFCLPKSSWGAQAKNGIVSSQVPQLTWKSVGCTIPKKHGNFTSGPSRAFIWSRTGKKRWKLARWVSQQEILLWLHSDSFTESRDTAILPPPPICHFRRPNATSNLTALDQVDFSHLGLFVFLGHQFCISCSSWQLDFNIFLNSVSESIFNDQRVKIFLTNNEWKYF